MPNQKAIAGSRSPTTVPPTTITTRLPGGCSLFSHGNVRRNSVKRVAATAPSTGMVANSSARVFILALSADALRC
jgi:hypothetical protein